ncbi:hypothetical protein XMV242_000814 [Marinobacterium sp. xm-v-242]|nr:hypothetical protein [Marinobacterium sp. xm-v-242]NRP76936.1 hypothetical protein [Marinobacterium sp. xm-m-383]
MKNGLTFDKGPSFSTTFMRGEKPFWAYLIYGVLSTLLLGLWSIYIHTGIYLDYPLIEENASILFSLKILLLISAAISLGVLYISSFAWVIRQTRIVRWLSFPVLLMHLLLMAPLLVRNLTAVTQQVF